ncbi:MAG TPA: hypothetical protein VLX91_07430 [Candidatus Acidoferrales bacterium]|nr:hypothetical protein [Candidatus Acidoferrales bacterium]
MENYRGIVQSIVMIGDGEYRVTFRAYNERDIEATFCENEDVGFTLYSMIARREENDFTLIAEGLLTDCVNILNENETVETVQLDEVEKWRIGSLANDIVSSLADGGMFVQCGEGETS